VTLIQAKIGLSGEGRNRDCAVKATAALRLSPVAGKTLKCQTGIPGKGKSGNRLGKTDQTPLIIIHAGRKGRKTWTTPSTKGVRMYYTSNIGGSAPKQNVGKEK